MFHQTAWSAVCHILLSPRPAFPLPKEVLQVLPHRDADLQAGAFVPELVPCRHLEAVVPCVAAVASVSASKIFGGAVVLHGAAKEIARTAHACESCCPAP